MLSLFESTLILGDTKLFPEEEIQTFTPRSSFSPPDVAIMNAVNTPQLQFSEVVSSPDYDSHQYRARFGFSPEENNSNLFKISGEE